MSSKKIKICPMRGKERRKIGRIMRTAFRIVDAEPEDDVSREALDRALAVVGRMSKEIGK